MYELGFGSDSRTVRSASSSSFTVSVWSSSNSNLASSSRCCMVKPSLRLSLLGFAMNYEFEFSVVFVWKGKPEMKKRKWREWIVDWVWELVVLWNFCIDVVSVMSDDDLRKWIHEGDDTTVGWKIQFQKNALLQVSIGKVFTGKAWKERVFDPFLGQRKWLLRVL